MNSFKDLFIKFIFLLQISGWQDRIVEYVRYKYFDTKYLLVRLSAIIWRLLEIHIFKVITFTIMYVSLHQVCHSKNSLKSDIYRDIYF